MERRTSEAVSVNNKKGLTSILKKPTSLAISSTIDSPPKGVQLKTEPVAVQEIITEEVHIPMGSPTFERVMRDLSDNLKNSLSTESSLTSIPDACEEQGEQNSHRVVRRTQSCNTTCSGTRKKKVRFPARQMSQSFTAKNESTSKVQRYSSFVQLKKKGSPNTFKFISSNESYSHEENKTERKTSIFELPDTQYLQRKLSYSISSTLS